MKSGPADPGSLLEPPGQARTRETATLPTIGVIIPAFNEAAAIERTVRSAAGAPGVEVFVADGGSADDTASLSRLTGATVVPAPRGRASQMNHAARLSAADILLFLHADTVLPAGYAGLVRAALSTRGVVGGAFRLHFEEPTPGMSVIELLANLRAALLQMPYGDQALFLPARLFRSLGGFPELPLMEDFELVRRLRRIGRVVVVPAAVVTSGRRFARLGALRATLLNQAILAAYFAGVSPATLARWYREAGRTKPRPVPGFVR